MGSMRADSLLQNVMVNMAPRLVVVHLCTPHLQWHLAGACVTYGDLKLLQALASLYSKKPYADGGAGTEQGASVCADLTWRLLFLRNPFLTAST